VDDKVRAFLEENHASVVCTLKRDGTPHVARVDVGLVEGRLWSSGTEDRVRTKHVRTDPRATLFVMDPKSPQHWLGLECHVTVLDGPDAVEQNLALYRAIAGEPDDLDEYRQAMVDERRLIYEFDIKKAYGQY
jgi:PPOX class probable F420-dependent enzyme